MSYCVYVSDGDSDLHGWTDLASRAQVERAVPKLAAYAKRDAATTGRPLSDYRIEVDWCTCDTSLCRDEMGLDPDCRTIEMRAVA